MLLFINSIFCCKIKTLHYSNTSHVIVYPGRVDGLSIIMPIQIHLMLLFIGAQWVGCKTGTHSNTSHVIVYQLPWCVFCAKPTNSNTSHVIVYPINPVLIPRSTFIQIHLMLLFILQARRQEWQS